MSRITVPESKVSKATWNPIEKTSGFGAVVKKNMKNPGAPQTVEESTINMPMIEDQIIGLGDLWDCRTETSPGNIFGKPLEKEHLEAFPMQTLEYYFYKVKDTRDHMTALNVSASVKVELMGGKIKASGSAKYDNEVTDNFNSEKITCRYDCNTFVVRVRPPPDDIINQAIKRKIIDGSLKATHYVQSVRLGGHLDGEITYHAKIDKNHMNIEGSFSVDINFGAFSASAQASLKMLETEYKEFLETDVTVNACPRFAKTPTNIAEMFEGIDKIDEMLKAEQHFKQIGDHILGVPLSFKLVPLTTLFDDYEPGGYFKVMSDEIMENFMSMLCTCQDFLGPNHMKALIREKEYRLSPIMMDEFNPFTEAVTRSEKEYHDIAVDIKKKAFEVYALYKTNQKDITDIQAVISDYDTRFYPIGIPAKVLDFVAEGRKQLTGIHVGDVVRLRDEEDRPTVRFFSNELDLNDWWTPERTIKILLKTSLAEDSPSGTFLRLFDYSEPLLKLGVQVGVAYPNISEEFSLTFKIYDAIIPYYKEDIMFALNVLGVASESGKVMSMLFYRLTGVAMGLNLLSITENIFDLPSIVDIFKESRDVILCETYPQLVAKLVETNDVWNFVLPLQGLHSAYEITKFFRQLKEKLPREYPRLKHRWIVGRFNITEFDAPLLFAFQDTELRAICLDHLDILIMLHQFRKSSRRPDLTLLSHESYKEHCLYPARANFTAKIIEGLILDHSTHVTDQVPNIPAFEEIEEPESGLFSDPIIDEEDEPKDDSELSKILEVTRGAAMRNELDVLNTIASFTIADLPPLYQKLEKYGWTDDGFETLAGEWGDLFDVLDRFLGDQAPYLVKVEGAIKALIDIRGPPPPERPEESDGEGSETEEPEGPETRHRKMQRRRNEEDEDEANEKKLQKVKDIIRFVTNFENPILGEGGYPVVYVCRGKRIDEAEKFAELKKEIDSFIPCSHDVELVIRGVLNALEAFYHAEIMGSSEFFNLMQLTSLVEGLASEEKTFKHVLIDIVRKYCQRTELVEHVFPKYPGAELKLKDSLDEKNLFKALGILANLRMNPLLHALHLDLYNLKNLSNVDHIKTIIENMRKLGFNDAQLKAVWLNPKFTFLIRQGMDNPALIETLYVELCINRNTDVIPRFVPKDIAEKMKELIYNVDEPTFEWIREWIRVDDVIQVFQILVTRKAVPLDFPSILRENMANSPELRKAFEDVGALFYWDAEQEYFTAPWSIDTIGQALARLMPPAQIRRENIILTQKSEMLVPVTLADIPLLDPWKKFTEGGVVQKLGMDHLLTIQPLRQTPLIHYDELNLTFDHLLPYLVQESRMSNPASLSALSVSTYIKYPPPDGTPRPGYIDFGSPKSLHNRFLLSRGDILTVLLNCADPFVAHALLVCMNKAPIALPLLIQKISSPEFKLILPALQNLIVDELVSLIPNPRLFSSPFRLILCLRVGAVDKATIGRSSILNQVLMNHSTVFSCLEEPGASHGIPIARAGYLEFTPLAKSTVNPEFWDNVVLPHYRSNAPDLLLLGNLHGDALNPSVLPILGLLSQTFVSCFVVFWKTDNWSELREKKRKLTTAIGKGSSVLDVVIYPDPTISAEVGEHNIIRMDSTHEIFKSKLKLFNVMREGFACKPKSQSSMESGIKRLIPKLLDPEQNDISGPESREFIHFLQSTTIQKVKEALISSHSRQEEPHPIIVQLNALFKAVLALPLPKRNYALAHVNYELDFLSGQSSLAAVQRILKLRKDLNPIQAAASYLDEEEIMELQDEIKAVLIRLEISTLSIADVFRHLLAADVSTNATNFAEYFLSGFPIELFQTTYGDVMWSDAVCAAMSSIPPDTKVFVLSMIGIKGGAKSTLLNGLFGGAGCGFREGPAGCTLGLQMRFLWLEDNLKIKLGRDAICVIDSEGFGAPENFLDDSADLNERNLATFILSISHLTIVNVLGDSMGEIQQILESAFTTLAKVNDLGLGITISAPDFLLVQQQVAPVSAESDGGADARIRSEWKSFVENVNVLTREQEMSVGVRMRAVYRMEAVKRRDKHDELVFRIRAREDNVVGYHHDVKRLYQRILDICATNNDLFTLGKWYERTATCWENILQNDSPNRSKSAAKLHESLLLKEQEAGVRRAICNAFRAHDKKYIEDDFLAKMDEIFEGDNLSLPASTDPSLALNEVHKKLKEVVNTCERNAKETPAGRNGEEIESVMCLECQKAFTLRENLFDVNPEGKLHFLLIQSITDYMDHVRESIWSKYKQHVVAKSVLYGISKELKEVWDEIPKTDKEEALLIFRRHLSTLTTVVPGAHEIEAEARKIYSTLPHIIPRIPNEHPLPDLEAIPAFDLIYYNKAVESSVNSPKDEKLNWGQNDWLIAKIQDIPRELLMDNDDSQIYMIGMVEEMKDRVNEVLVKFAALCGELLLPDFKWEVHLFAIKTFKAFMAKEQIEWDEDYNPTKQLQKEEVEKRFPDLFADYPDE